MQTQEHSRKITNSDLSFPVVGIGASAGGVAALTRFFEPIDGPGGMAFVVTLHRPPKHESNIDAILQRVTALEVVQVTERMAIRPDRVHVMPPSKDLGVDDDYLRIVDAAEADASYKRIAPVRRVDGDDASTVRCDPVRIERIVWNLLSNAIKFTDVDGNVTVSPKRVASEAIEVVDTVRGISAAFLPNVILMFRQERESAGAEAGTASGSRSSRNSPRRRAGRSRCGPTESARARPSRSRCRRTTIEPPRPT